MKIIILFTSLLLNVSIINSQSVSTVDSLLNILKTTKEDTLKISTLLNLCSQNISIAKYDESTKYAEQALLFSQKVRYQNGIATSYKLLGIISFYLGEYTKALFNYENALNIENKIGNKVQVAIILKSMGNVYQALSDYAKALEYYQNSLTINEKLGNPLEIGFILTNIGSIYTVISDYPNALNYYAKALTIFKLSNYEPGISQILINTGVIYALKSDTIALQYFKKALIINAKYGDNFSTARIYNSTGKVYFDQSNFQKALEYYKKSLLLEERFGDKNGIADLNIKIGQVYSQQKNFDKALILEKKGLSIALEIGSKDLIKNAYRQMAIIDSAMNNFRGAFEYNKLYTKYNDSIFNNNLKNKLIQIQINNEVDRFKDSTNLEQIKIDSAKNLKEEKHIRNYLFAGIIFVSAFLIVLIIQSKKLSRKNILIESEKNRSEELLLNILPSKVAEELKLKGHASPTTYGKVTVMFIDFKDFTLISKHVSPELLIAELDHCFSAFDLIVEKYKLEKIKTIGDAYMCVGGLPVSTYTHPMDIVNAAIEIFDFISLRRIEKTLQNEPYFEARIGIHTGTVVAGIVGIKKFAYDIWGETVNIASRMERNGEAGKINVSGNTYDLIKHKFSCTKRDSIEIKNIGIVDMYFVQSAI